jgi:hypothetical protein
MEKLISDDSSAMVGDAITVTPEGSSTAAGGSGSLFTPDDRFRADATEALGRFREALERVVFSVTKSVQNSRALQAAMGVDRNVSWQVFKLLGPIDTLSTVSYVPAAVSLRKLLAAAKKRGAAEEAVADAAAAFGAFERLVEETTADREQFETVVLSYTDSTDSVQIGMHHRKAAFKADYHFFGVAVDTLAFALFFHPGALPDTVDFVGLRQMLGLRRLRASTDVVVDRWKMNRDQADSDNDFLLSDAFDPDAAAQYNAAVLPDFCSRPLVPLVTSMNDSGDVRTLLKHRDIGVGQEVDLATGRLCRGMSVGRSPGGRPVLQGLVEIGRPTRVQVIDTFVHRPTWPTLIPHAGVFAHLSRRLPNQVEQEGVRLPFGEQMKFMGTGPDVLRIQEVPRYAELVRYACRTMGWSFDDFDLYRIRFEYPLMDSNVLLRLESIAEG